MEGDDNVGKELLRLSSTEQPQNEYMIKQTVLEPGRQQTDGKKQASSTRIHFVNIIVFLTSNMMASAWSKRSETMISVELLRAHVQDSMTKCSSLPHAR